nr:peroxynitrite isomerase THAP4-like [Misgurnus anguillicaudatus]
MWMNDNNSQNALALLPLRGHSQSTPTSYRRQNQKDRLDLLCYILTRESRKSCVSKFISIEMVLNCVVQGCTTKSRKGLEVSFHHFPIKDLERCKKWLRAINHPKFGEDTDMGNLKTRRICSRHFKEEDYEPNVLGMKRTTLKDTAIPSIFTFPDDEQPGPSGIKRIRLEPPIASAGLVSSDDEGKLLLTSTPVKIPTSVHEQFSPCPSTPGGLNTTISSIEAVGENDESYQPESTITFTSTSSSSSSDEGEKDWHKKKLIVKGSSLMSLSKFCQMCRKPISSKMLTLLHRGRWIGLVLGGHDGTWKSSPEVRGMPEVNLLAAEAVLFRGGTYTELSGCFHI